jgi:hypothetical protein
MPEMTVYGIRINSDKAVVAVNLPIEEVVKREIDPWWVDTHLDRGLGEVVVLPEHRDLQFKRLDNLSNYTGLPPFTNSEQAVLPTVALDFYSRFR